MVLLERTDKMSNVAESSYEQSSLVGIGPSTSKYCLLKIVRQWPYKKTSRIKQEVLKRFFDKEPFFSRRWDIYCISSTSYRSVLVVPLHQVEEFFEQVYNDTDVELSPGDDSLLFDLESLPSSTIRFAGTTTTLQEYESLGHIHEGQDSTENHLRRALGANIGLRNEKKARGEKKKQTQLQNRISMLKSATQLVNRGEEYAFFSLDVESWEKNHDIITEIGLTRYTPKEGGWLLNTANVESGHIIVKEHRFFKNGEYVPDASQQFEFGKSDTVPLADLKTAIRDFIGGGINSQTSKQLVIIGHDIKADFEYLRKLGYDLEAEHSPIVFDTVEIWRAFSETTNGISLGRLCTELDISAWNLHNAGNDARYTMQAFLEMATKSASKSGNPS
ncbi:hypothetical protein ABW19_dt0204356 [Dactylella cylindrospora]|nr:hypothetical protein ABW19_dt0204356 [Dactylella cylindrospora]